MKKSKSLIIKLIASIFLVINQESSAQEPPYLFDNGFCKSVDRNGSVIVTCIDNSFFKLWIIGGTLTNPKLELPVIRPITFSWKGELNILSTEEIKEIEKSFSKVAVEKLLKQLYLAELKSKKDSRKIPKLGPPLVSRSY